MNDEKDVPEEIPEEQGNFNANMGLALAMGIKMFLNLEFLTTLLIL